MKTLSKSARPFTAPAAAEKLDQLAYLERACAHLLAGWIVKTPDLEVKIAWGQHLAANMEHAARLHDRARALRGDEPETKIPAAWRDSARAIDGSRETVEVLRGILSLKQYLAAAYQDYLERADPVADAGSIQIIESANRAARAQIKWTAKKLRAVNRSNGREVGVIHELPLHKSRKKDAAEELTFDDAIWTPLDRAPRVARPAQMRRGEPGALRLLPLHPRSRKDTGLFLHNFLNEEFTTLELVARNSYEHPEMPWAFHRDSARHAGDEARHAQMFVRALPDFGIEYGDYPIYTYSYEGEYEFPANAAWGAEYCEPGSPRELLWRILLRQVVHEGLALDSTPFEVKKRTYLRQPELARIFGYIYADEVFHAGAGVKWSRYLVHGDGAQFARERETAYNFYSERLKDRRLTWVASHLEQAAEEATQLDEMSRNYQFPFKIEVNVAARQRAGFSDEEIRRVIDSKL